MSNIFNIFRKKERQKKLWQEEQSKKSWWNLITSFVVPNFDKDKIKTIDME